MCLVCLPGPPTFLLVPEALARRVRRPSLAHLSSRGREGLPRPSVSGEDDDVV